MIFCICNLNCADVPVYRAAYLLMLILLKHRPIRHILTRLLNNYIYASIYKDLLENTR